MIRRSILAALFAGMLAMLSIGTAFAHECVISSRSAQGNEGATNSKVWGKLHLETILGEFLGLSDEAVEWAMERHETYGLPEFWVTRFDKTIGEASSNPNLADGKGLDHLIGLVGPQVFALAQDAMAATSGDQ